MSPTQARAADAPRSPWCGECGSQHAASAECPGPLLATGSERHGWRVRIGTPSGPRIFGVVVAPVGDRWRARILTFPDVLWLVPGGNVSMKFVGDTPAAAETQAIDYIRQHCRERKFAVGDVLPPAQPGAIPAERSPSVGSSESERKTVRKLHATPVRFGETSPVHEAMTHDLSEEGLFIVTRELIRPRKRIRMLLRIGGYEVELQGVVRWSRMDQVQGRPTGMGVQLEEIPGIYTHYVRHLP